MRYIGSKSATLPWISETVARKAPRARSMCDPFAGTCTVARHFKERGMHVVTGDVLRLSHVLQLATLAHDAPPAFEIVAERIGRREGASSADNVIAYLDALPASDGYFSQEFAPSGSPGRLFFSDGNAGRIDAMRAKIADWRSDGIIDEKGEAWVLAALILATDRVANTAGTYYAHLKELSRKARQPIRLMPPPTTSSGTSGGCHNATALDTAGATETDILYLDPPYNVRDYASYYHLPETLARGDAPTARGKSGVPTSRVERSPFYRTSEAATALSQICAKARARYIVVHYTTEGAIPHESIMNSLQKRGEVTFEDRAVRAYSAKRAPEARETWHRMYWCNVGDGTKIDTTTGH